MSREKALLLVLTRHRLKRRRLETEDEYTTQRRFWVRKIYAEREEKGEFHTLILEMKLGDHEMFFKQFRMLPSKLEELLRWLAPKIIKDSTRRKAIGPEERLCATLRYLVTGDAQVSIGASYRISVTSMGRINEETTIAIWNAIEENGFLKVPSTTQE